LLVVVFVFFYGLLHEQKSEVKLWWEQIF